jgi:hypothetical protein
LFSVKTYKAKPLAGEALGPPTADISRAEKLAADIATPRLRAQLREKVRQFKGFIGPLQEEEAKRQIERMIRVIPGVGPETAISMMDCTDRYPDLDKIISMPVKKLAKLRNFKLSKATIVFRAFEDARSDLRK